MEGTHIYGLVFRFDYFSLNSMKKSLSKKPLFFGPTKRKLCGSIRMKEDIIKYCNSRMWSDFSFLFSMLMEVI